MLWMGIEVTSIRANRRGFLTGLLASSLVPRASWADAGSPRFLSAAARKDASYVLCGINDALEVLFQIPLPARGHAAAAHPTRPEAVAFARRPGTYAVVIDCITGKASAMLAAPEGRHFYGHGAFSSDGSLLYTTENDFEAGQGRIGIWDARKGYTRIAEIASGGIGPHDIKRIAGSDIFVVANGGIDTHPDSGRTKLNIPTMAPNLAYIEGGDILEIVEPPRAMHKNSIRHLALDPQGAVAFGMQSQGDGPVQHLVGLHQRGAAMVFMHASSADTRAMQGYVGSIAVSKDGAEIAVTSPRGGLWQRYNVYSQRLKSSELQKDVCGIASLANGFVTTTGKGILKRGKQQRGQTDLMWDNHLIEV